MPRIPVADSKLCFICGERGFAHEMYGVEVSPPSFTEEHWKPIMVCGGTKNTPSPCGNLLRMALSNLKDKRNKPPTKG